MANSPNLWLYFEILGKPRAAPELYDQLVPPLGARIVTALMRRHKEVCRQGQDRLLERHLRVCVARRTHRTYTPAFKAEAVAACQQPGTSIAALASDHGMNANVLHRCPAAYISSRIWSTESTISTLL